MVDAANTVAWLPPHVAAQITGYSPRILTRIADRRGVLTGWVRGRLAALGTALARWWSTCRCGHPIAWHHHHRNGRDCSAAGCWCMRPSRWRRPLDPGRWDR